MRNMKFWCFMSVLVSAVFLFSGCGGGSLDGTNNGNSGNTGTNTQIIYDAQSVLPGIWKPYEIVTAKINGSEYELGLSDTYITLADVSINNDTGTAVGTNKQTWYSVSDSSTYTALDFDKTDMNMVRGSNKNSWICTQTTRYPIITLTISEDRIIKMNYRDGNKGVNADVNLKKSN